MNRLPTRSRRDAGSGWAALAAPLALAVMLSGCASYNRAMGTDINDPWMQCAKAGGELSNGQAVAATALGVAGPLVAPDKFQAVQDCRNRLLGK